MNWNNVKLVWQREIRDQLRDRRTLFVIGVLPLLIYPMMGIAFSRLSQFMRQNPATIAVVGYEQLADRDDVPQLVHDGGFARGLFYDRSLADRLHVETIDDTTGALKRAQQRMKSGELDAVVYFPPGFAERLQLLREATRGNGKVDAAKPQPVPPDPVVFYDTRDESQLANSRVQSLLDRWQAQVVRSNLVAGRLPIDITNPFEIKGQNIDSEEGRQAAFWSKLLPFIVFLCALTGAFYPAVDLCAGEKERGTLETLLTSPAQRSEIVGGKLLTVITFSIGSALCNLASMAITGHLIIKQLNAMTPPGQDPLAPPSLAAIGWLVVALLPMALFFSAASLALAALARSTKEGQYYLMPMFLVCMPLMTLPLLPGIELNLATSLLPISGMVLLMQAAMEGKLLLAATYVIPVGIVTIGSCAVAMRWAIDQFNQESVLFRDTENFDLITWMRFAYNHRPATPRLATAALLIIIIFLVQFGVQSLQIDWRTRSGFVATIMLSLVGAVLLPTLIMATTSIRSWRKTFLLARPVPWKQVSIALLLSVVLMPVATALLEMLNRFIPLPPGFAELLKQLANQDGGWHMSIGYWLLLMAVLPAVCEELAFRGFVLSGFRSRMSSGWAVVLSAVFFGLAHATALQQTISATFLGLILGYIAVKTSQITPCIAFHMGYNGLQLLRTRFADTLADGPLAGWVFRPAASPVVGLGFSTPVVVLCGLAAITLLWQVGRQPCRLTGTFGLHGGARSPLPPSAPTEESGA